MNEKTNSEQNGTLQGEGSSDAEAPSTNAADTSPGHEESEAPADATPQAPNVEELQRLLKEEQRRVAEIRQAYTEAAADFGRTRARLERAHDNEKERARLQIATRMFEVADNLDRTLDATQNSQDVEGLREGVALVRDQFFRELAAFGIQRFSPQGEPFNPAEHEAIGIVPTDNPEEDNTVMTVLTPGYRASSHILRPAIVQVGKLTS